MEVLSTYTIRNISVEQNPNHCKLILVIITNYGHHVDNQQHAKEVAQCIKQKPQMRLVLESGSLEVSIKDLMPNPASILAKLLK